jgi:hypothetical protein
MFELTHWINLYILQSGRRIWAHRKVRAEAVLRGLTGLVAHVDRALEHDLGVRARQHAWQETKNRAPSPAAVKSDIELDRALGSLHDVLAAFAAAPVDAAFKAPAATLLAALFPAGVAALTQRSFEDEQTAVAHLLTRMDGELAPAVEQLGLVPHRESIRAHNEALGAQLGAARPAGVSFDEVDALDVVGQDLVLETVARILGAFPSASESDRAARAALLAPIAEQSDDVRRARQRRRTTAPADVDPETGEVAAPQARM